MKTASLEKIFIYDKINDKSSYILQAQFQALLRKRISEIVNDLTNGTRKSDKIYVYGYVYTSTFGMKIGILDDLSFTIEKYKKFVRQLRKLYKETKIYVIKGKQLYAQKVFIRTETKRSGRRPKILRR